MHMSSQNLRTPIVQGRLLLLVSMLTLCFGGGLARAADGWEQWGGPNRDFTTRGAAIATSWPEAGPRQLWSRELGDGHSTIVTDGRTLFATYLAGEQEEAVIAIDAATGKTRWEHRYPIEYVNESDDRRHNREFGGAPQSTPLLIGNRLYTVGFTSVMHCLDASSGKVHWKQDLLRDLKGTLLFFGYAASPIAYRDTVILPLGGKGQGIVALDQKTGAVRWKATDYDASWSSPILVKVDGEDHLVTFMAGFVVGISPVDGKEHWSIEYKNRFSSSIVTPVWCPDNLLYFVAGGDTTGGRMVRLKRADGRIAPEDVWQNNKVQGGLANPVCAGDVMYGAGPTRTSIMMAFDVKTGEIVWRERGFSSPKPIKVGDKLIILNEDGTLMVASPTREKIDVHCKAQLLEAKAWAAPTIAGTKLYLRDRKRIMALDLGMES